MPIQFNLQVALQKESYAKECYQKYCNGELNISDEDIQTLQEHYKGKMDGWKPEVSTDTNDYVIEDTQTEKQLGKSKSANKSSIATAAMSTFGAAGSFGVKKIVEHETLKNMPQSIVLRTADGGKAYAKEQGTKAGIIAGCVMALATALKYIAEKTNKAEHDRLMELKDIMEGKNTELDESQGVMENSSEEIETMTEEAETVQEEAEDEIEKKEEEIDEAKETQQTLADKAETEGLTEGEKSEYVFAGETISELGEEITNISEEASDTVEEINENISSEQETYDNAQDITDEAIKAADEAESFDEQTRTMMTIEAVSQGINAASGMFNGARAIVIGTGSSLFGIGAAYLAAGAAGLAGAGISTKAVAEQINFIKDVNSEIHIRKNIQANAEQTQEIIDTGVEELDVSVDTTEIIEEDLSELGVPEDETIQEQQPLSDTPEVNKEITTESEKNPEVEDIKDKKQA